MNYKEQLQNLAQKFQKGGQKPYSEKSYDEADIKDFYKKMVGSEWYKNRLIKNGYDDQYSIGVEGVLKKRMNRIDRAHVDNVQSDDGFNNQVYRFLTSGDFVKTGTGAYYNHDEDEITLVKSQMDKHRLHPRSVLAHEFGHAETGQSISNIEQEMLGKLRPEEGLTPHNKSPFENKSDINALRYNLYKNNLYDPSTGKFKTKSGLFESKLLKPVDTDFGTKRLRQHYGDKYLETLMNTIAENSNNDEEVQYAQQGGQTSMDHPYNMGDINGFFRKMINAPWYRERLKKTGYDDPGMLRQHDRDKSSLDLVVRSRNTMLSDLDFDISNDVGTNYQPSRRKINLNPDEINRLKAHPRSALSHEVSHAVTNHLTPGRINKQEASFIRNKIVPGADEMSHVLSPNEAKADIDAMRYNLYKAGKFDPSTGRFQTKDGKFSPDLLELLKNDYQTKRMRKVYSDESLKEMFDTLAQNNSEQTVSYAQVGGQIQEDWKQKYSTNPYFKNREDWGDKLSQKFPNAKNTVKDSIYTVAKQSGVDPAILYTSAMEEGMKLALNGKDTFERREGYNQFRKSNPKGAQEFPIDGGYFYGLNTFGDKYGKIIKPSSLPRGFKYAPYEQKDAQGNKLYTSAAFRSHDDAIAAKAAMMKQVESAMTARLQKNGLNLTPEARKFFDMVGYNMGEDKTIEMIQSYQQKGYLKDDKFLDPNFQPASWKEPYTNVQRRYQNYKILNDQGYFKDYAPQPAPDNGQQTVVANKQVGGTIDTSSLKNQLNNLSEKYTESFQKGGEIERCIPCEEKLRAESFQIGGTTMDKMISALNPKNWGVDDYSKYKTYNEAFRAARNTGDEEFLWNNKRYRTDIKNLPGKKITQRDDFQGNIVSKLYEGIIRRDPNSAHGNLRRYYEGLPMKGNMNVQVSKYRPTDETDKNSKYISIQDDKFKDAIIYYTNNYYKETGKSNRPNYAFTPDNKIDKNLEPLSDLGNFKLKKLKDERGEYVQYYDIWNYSRGDSPDLNKTEHLGATKPFEVYDRIYVKDYGDNKSKRMYYNDNELSKLNIDARNFDTLALQRELINRGYKLPNSIISKTNQPDGIYGDETKKALQDWQSKNTKKFQSGGKLTDNNLRDQLQKLSEKFGKI